MLKLSKSSITAWSFIFVLHVLFYILQLKLGNWYLSDSVEYLAEAKNILHGGHFYAGDLLKSIDYDLYTKRPPLYPLFLGLFYYILPGPAFTGLVQMLLSLTTLYLLQRLFIHYGVRQGSTWLMLLALLITPAQLIYCQLIMSEILFQFVLTMAFYVFVHFIETKSFIHERRFNLLLIAGMLVKPVLYLFALLNFLYSIWLKTRVKAKFYRFSVYLPLLFLVLYFGWNYYRTGYAHYSSITNINLLHYNAYFLLIKEHGDTYADSTVDAIEAEAATKESYADGEKFLRSEATSILQSNLKDYLSFHLVGVVHFFLDPGRFDLYNFFGIQNENQPGLLYYYSKEGYAGIWRYLKEQPVVIILLLPLIMLGNILKTISLAFFAFNRRVKLEIRLMLLFLVLYIAFATGPLGASRFALPVFPLLLFTLPFTLAQTKGFFRGRKVTASA